jgi:DNA polymerase elongation subunit (family B)
MNNITTEMILNESRKLEDILNNDLLKRFAKLHNIKDKYNLFNLKQEVVAKKGYFLDVKKKYALHIINNEGIEKDELFIKGLITQRSDYPSVTRELIMELIKLLIQTEKPSFSKIRNFINESNLLLTKMAKEGDPRVARPVSFTKKLKDYKVIPSHVKAMVLWNDCEYNYFTRGTKGRLFRIKGVDRDSAPEKVMKQYEKLQKANSIVLPIDDEKLPEYYIIDVKAMIDFAWIDRVNEFIKPISDLVFQNVKDDSIITF